MENQKIKRSVGVGRRFCAVLLVLMARLTCASAAESASCSLSLNYFSGGAAIAGARFRLYRAAEAKESGEYAFVGDFARYESAVNDLNEGKWDVLAATLAGYAAADAIAPDREGETAEDGSLRFGVLPEGLYLLTGDVHRSGAKYYTPEPALVFLSEQSDVAVWPKCAVSEDKLKNLTVMKVWTGDSAASRPAQIAVKLLCDGVEMETVALSAANNWRHVWTNLAGDHLWQVVESPVPSGYTVRIDYEGDNVVVTNAYSEGNHSSETNPSNPSGNSKLPQTGLLWWPVPVLALAGMVLFLTGWLCQKRGGR